MPAGGALAVGAVVAMLIIGGGKVVHGVKKVGHGVGHVFVHHHGKKGEKKK